MNDELDKLKRDYRDIEAPPHLATRIRAEAGEQKTRPQSWMPVAATMTVVVAVIGLLPFLTETTQTESPRPTRPSLSALTSLTPVRPTAATPDLSQVRSVTVPRMPPKPRLTPERPQSNHQIENDILKENDHANS